MESFAPGQRAKGPSSQAGSLICSLACTSPAPLAEPAALFPGLAHTAHEPGAHHVIVEGPVQL